MQPGHERSGAIVVVLVQDHQLLASAIARILESEPDLTVSAIVGTGADAAEVAARDRADVVLMDFRLPDMTAPAAASLIRGRIESAAIVFISAEESETALLDAIDAGATAYLTKSATTPEQIVKAVRQAARGEVVIPVSLFAKAIARHGTMLRNQQDRDAAQLTPRELEVLNLLAEGLDTSAISSRLRIAPSTTSWHVTHVIEKLQAHSKLQAVLAAARLGLIQLYQT